MPGGPFCMPARHARPVKMKRIVLSALLALLASCGDEERPEAPTAAESQRLDEAEEMLNRLANEEGAAPEGTAPPTNAD